MSQRSKIRRALAEMLAEKGITTLTLPVLRSRQVESKGRVVGIGAFSEDVTGDRGVSAKSVDAVLTFTVGVGTDGSVAGINAADDLLGDVRSVIVSDRSLLGTVRDASLQGYEESVLEGGDGRFAHEAIDTYTATCKVRG